MSGVCYLELIIAIKLIQKQLVYLNYLLKIFKKVSFFQSFWLIRLSYQIICFLNKIDPLFNFPNSFKVEQSLIFTYLQSSFKLVSVKQDFNRFKDYCLSMDLIYWLVNLHIIRFHLIFCFNLNRWFPFFKT